MQYDFDKPLHPQINRELATRLCSELGYQWPNERIERIAEDATKAIAKGFPAEWTFSDAFNTELIMYGNGSINQIVGIINLTN